jgi:hypothetical protein
MLETKWHKSADGKRSDERVEAEAKQRKEQLVNNVFVGWWNARTGG